MRETLRDKDRLRHILKAIDNIENFMAGKSEEDFYNDPILFHAIVNNLSIIGEASYKLSKEFIATHTLTPWRHIINMRHFLVHGYYQVSAKIVWDTMQNDLVLLKRQISKYLTDEDNS